LQKTVWPCRLQKITAGKFHEILPNNFELYLDGSHNTQGATTIRKFLLQQKNKKVYVIFSMLKDKDCDGFLKKISAQVDNLLAVKIADEPKSRTSQELCEIAKKNKINSATAKNFDDAFKKVFTLDKSSKPALVLICGSLYLAGNFLEENK